MPDQDIRITDGQISFSGGINSDVVRTKKLPGMDGVDENQLHWGSNLTVRGGGIGVRNTLHPLIENGPWHGLFQGGYLYQPDFGDPIGIFCVGGRVYRVRLDTDNSITDLSALYGHTMPANIEKFYFAQGECFLVIQAGDFTTLPLFYDFGIQGIRPESLRRSNGLVFPGVSNPANELPAAGPMDFYAQRFWYAFGDGYAGGDISRNLTSGTPAFAFRDSILKLTENPIAYGGDAFGLPTSAGNIRALAHASNLDTALGETNLFIFTRRAIYACSAPITRDDWTAANTNTMPLQKVALNKGGTYSDRSVVAVNGDLFFVSPPNGDIRSIQTSLRFFGQWGQVPLSTNENRVLNANDRALLHASTGIQFDNRLLEASMPINTPVGVGFRTVIPLDFDVISTFQERKPPAWEGIWDISAGPYVLQFFEGDFGGRERGFAMVWSVLRSQIELWEIRPDLRFDGNGDRVVRNIEFPAYPFRNPFALKELETGELWIDKMLGTVDFEFYYRPDSYACWIPWWATQLCAAKDCTEDVDNPCPNDNYPKELKCEQDALPIALPKPPFPPCVKSNQRPANLGYQFQVRLVTRGWCRIRGLLLHAIPKQKRPFEGLPLTCQTTDLPLGSL